MKNQIRQLRTEYGLTQEGLSKLVGVSRQSIVAIESGKYNPSLDLAFKIATVFERKIEDVFIFNEQEEV